MSKIYIPTKYLNNCNIVYSDYIRSYTNSSRTEWVDIYFKSDYIEKLGYTTYSQNVVCDSINSYTDNIYYRYDLANILICFSVISFIAFYLPIKIFSKIFRKGSL